MVFSFVLLPRRLQGRALMPTLHVVANGCLFIIGGEGEYADARGLSVENEAYDPWTDQWISLPPMPTPTHGLVGAAFANGRIHLPGGSITLGGGSGTVIHWTYRPELSCR